MEGRLIWAETFVAGDGMGHLSFSHLSKFFPPAMWLFLLATVEAGVNGFASASEFKTGTAFAVTSSGDLITNYHVVKGCSNVLTIFKGVKVAGKVVAQDAEQDLALIRIEKTTNALKLRLTPPVALGESAIVYGFPLVGVLSPEGNFTIGNVSGLRGFGDDPNLIQITTPIQPGNSGGAVLDEGGNVIGVVVARYERKSAQNVNFAISLDVLTSFLTHNNIPFEATTQPSKLPNTKIAELGRDGSYLIVCSPPELDARTENSPPKQPTSKPQVEAVPLGQLKLSETLQPYPLLPNIVDITISNLGSHFVTEVVLGYSRKPTADRKCPQDIRSYDGVKTFDLGLKPGDSSKIRADLIRDAEYFCLVRAVGVPTKEAPLYSPPDNYDFPQGDHNFGAPCPEGFGAYCVPGYKKPQLPDQLAELRSEALNFVNKYIQYGNEAADRSLRLVEDMFAEQVFHFGKFKTKQEVLAEEARHWERWPKQIYNLRPESVSAACSLSPDQCTVDAILDWDASSAPRNEGSTGSSTWHVVLSKSQGSMVISAMGGKVIDKRNYKPNQGPEGCLGPLCLFGLGEEEDNRAKSATEKRRLKVSSKDGILNLRDGPGIGHALILAMPAGSIVRQVGGCVKGDDNVSRYKWCNVELNGSAGWASAYGLELAEPISE